MSETTIQRDAALQMDKAAIGTPVDHDMLYDREEGHVINQNFYPEIITP